MARALLEASDLEGRVAVVTGAGGGLGRQTARTLARRGARVVLLDISQPALEASAEDLAGEAEGLVSVVCDITDEASVGAAAEQVAAEAGGCDILVNNAGILTKAALAEETAASWSRTLAVNLRGVFLCTRVFGAQMLGAGAGAIVNIASIGATVPTRGAGAYCASKAGVLALTRQTAMEWGSRGVRANAVSPGYMRTPMTEANYQASGVMQERASLIPLGRIADLSEVAAVVAFLAGPASSYLNGVNMTVDGGFVLSTTGRVPHAAGA